MIERDFERARWKADWKKVLHFLTGKPSLLLPFDLVRRQVVMKSISYEGVQEIAIDRVVGSVSRYHEFDREFLPKRSESGDRWSRVRRVFESDAGFSPIKVYEVGEAYFVVDGNHRVSVARQLGMTSIEAEIVKFQPNVPITKDTDIPDLIIKKEYSDFLEETHLDVLRPEQHIEFTRPGRYDVLREHIAKRRYFMGLEQHHEIDYEHAVESWYDGLYHPLIEIFRQERLLDRFPRRTEADLYVWVTEHLYFLRERFGDDIGLVDATRDFAQTSAKMGKILAGMQRAVRHLPILGERIKQSESALCLVERRLAGLERRGVLDDVTYRVPSAWMGENAKGDDPIAMTAIQFWRSRIRAILDQDPVARIPGNGGEWSRRAVVYNLYVRSSCAFDHDGDGELHVLNRHGLRETGTFIKAITMLPYIQALGCNTVHLLPITRIGRDGHKGTLGSPYAIANPYQLDETLSEPVLQLGPDVEFRAFVEAAHRLGIRVVLEFVFRTAAKDSEWIPQHPEWFYWIRAEANTTALSEPNTYCSPTFSQKDLTCMKSMVGRGEFHGLPAPSPEYRSLYVHPPRRETIQRDAEAYVGHTVRGERAEIPGAFADWPPDDAQPPWSDVTYLRLYNHPDFNYMAYNTIRMYDSELAQPENEVAELWDRIAGILPYFQDRFLIDGAMIDMGHALPSALKERVITGARGADPGFALWDEDFDVRERTKAEGYNAIVGNVWWNLHRDGLRIDMVRKIAEQSRIMPVFATPETHNTPRCAARLGGTDRSACLWVVGAFLPAIPVVHSGFELGETVPVNTGLDFTDEERARYPEVVLPLYNACAYEWSADRSLRDVIQSVLQLRREYESLVTNSASSTMLVYETECEKCLAYERTNHEERLLIIANLSSASASVRLRNAAAEQDQWIDRLTGQRLRVDATDIYYDLAAWQCAVLVPEPDHPAHRPASTD